MSESHAGLRATRLPGSGRSRRKLLVIGDHQLVSVDAGHEPAAVTVSKALAVHGQRPTGGIDLDVLTDLIPAMRAITGSSVSWRLWRYDTVIVVLTPHGAGARTAPLDQDLLTGLAELAQASPLVVVIPTPGNALPHPHDERRRPRRQARQLVALSPTVQIITARTTDDGHLQNPVGIADTLLNKLDHTPTPPQGTQLDARIGPQTEAQHQQAFDRSLQARGGITPDLLRVAALARNTFDTPYAQVNLLSGGALHSIAHAGRSTDALLGPLTAMVVQNNAALLIEDTHADTRCTQLENTPGLDTIRFYAGHPITSDDGHRIGTLCVFDTTPHPVDDNDDTLIRDLALLAEAEINALAR